MIIIEVKDNASSDQHFIRLNPFLKEFLAFIYDGYTRDDTFYWYFNHHLILDSRMDIIKWNMLHRKQSDILCFTVIIHWLYRVCESKRSIFKCNANNTIDRCRKLKWITFIFQHFLSDYCLQVSYIRSRKTHIHILHWVSLL